MKRGINSCSCATIVFRPIMLIPPKGTNTALYCPSPPVSTRIKVAHKLHTAQNTAEKYSWEIQLSNTLENTVPATLHQSWQKLHTIPWLKLKLLMPSAVLIQDLEYFDFFKERPLKFEIIFALRQIFWCMSDTGWRGNYQVLLIIYLWKSLFMFAFRRQLLGDSTCRWICVYRAGEVMKHEASAAIRNDCGTTWRIYTNTYQYVPMADMKTNVPMTDTWKYHPCQLSILHLSTQCSHTAENKGPKIETLWKFALGPKTWNLCIEMCSFAMRQKYDIMDGKCIITEGNGFTYWQYTARWIESDLNGISQVFAPPSNWWLILWSINPPLSPMWDHETSSLYHVTTVSASVCWPINTENRPEHVL